MRKYAKVTKPTMVNVFSLNYSHIRLLHLVARYFKLLHMLVPDRKCLKVCPMSTNAFD